MTIGSTVWADGPMAPDEISEMFSFHLMNDDGTRNTADVYASQAMIDRLTQAYHPARVTYSGSFVVLETDFGRVFIFADETLSPDVIEFRTEDC